MKVTETTVSNWGFTKNAGTVTSVNNVSPDGSGNVSLTASSVSAVSTDLSNFGKPYVKTTYRSGSSWYRIYSDGWCEMGGRYTNNSAGTVAYLKTFANSNYTLQGTCMSNVGAAIYDDELPHTPTASGFSYSRSSKREYS